MASRRPAVTLLVAALLAATITNAFIQPLDDEDLMFDDEDGTKSRWESEAPVAPPWVSSPLSRPRRQFFSLDDDFDHDGSGSGFEPHTYRIKLHILRPWESDFVNRNSNRFLTLQRRIQSSFRTAMRNIRGDKTVHVIYLSNAPSGNVLAAVDVMVTDYEDYGSGELRRTLNNLVSGGRLGELRVNNQYYSFNEPRGPTTTLPTTTTTTPLQCSTDDTPKLCSDGLTLACYCDQIVQCPDGEDETNCGPVCGVGQQQCGNDPTCVYDDQICDGVQDCLNNFDEENCRSPTTTLAPTTTTTTPLQCSSDDTPKLCSDGLTLACYCDKIVQCPDGEDESNCGPECAVGKVKCGNELPCIYEDQFCDGIQDCQNNWDEADCRESTTTPPTTTTTRVQCPSDATPAICSDGVTFACFCDKIVQCPDGGDEANCDPACGVGQQQCGNDPTCVYDDQICDGFQDCPNDFDEEKCREECLENQFQCDDGTCIEQYRHCDHITDCVNGEDEAGCPCEHPNFQCISLMCIPPDQHCDGKEDCDDGSDEVGCQCPEGFFRCSTEKNCINITHRCDGLVQCADGSDEEDCPCQVWQWTCRDGGCISASGRCDGTIDCSDTSDEYGCPPTTPPTPPGCLEGEFTCRSGSCVPAQNRCDWVMQCPDGSDEEGCPLRCRDDQWQCLDGTCVSGTARCDGVFQCFDRSDEENCPTTPPAPPPRCGPEEWTCKDGRCLAAQGRCDGVPQCYDGSDEENCPTPPPPPRCGSQEWMCLDGACIPLQAHCNRRYDCLDRSDEENCPECQPHEWRCVDDGSCIPQSSVCNGLAECPDGSDEDERECQPTFPCRDGTETNINSRCDSEHNCPDASDETDCPVSSCNSPSTFRCNNGYCIRADQRCDGTTDCQDATDERDCPPLCTNNEFRCDDGTCIPLEAKCNGQPDCQDRSDEANCTCRPDQFRCEDGTCLEPWRKCNDINECPNGEDERGCPCRTGQHLCERDGKCISETQVCDGQPDCTDGSDELNCTELSLPAPCGRDEWQCSQGQQCIPHNYVCDGHQDCADNSDETVGCVAPPPPPPPPSCSSDQFQCQSGQCITLGYRCDGVQDCDDGSDEWERECPPKECLSNEFACSDGKCVGLDKWCDGNFDCIDRSDEPYLCDQVNGSCSEGQFKCSDGSCIEKNWECDSVPDCADGGDELNCCKATEFKCGDGTCISEVFLCDRRNDCTDGSDEQNCEICQQDEFQCRNGECVPISYKCDGSVDCSDASDEDPRICQIECTENEFECQSGECVSLFVRCDSQRDCIDGSDEIKCDDCSPYEFKCRDGQCVDQSVLCDGIRDCLDRSDEENCTSGGGGGIGGGGGVISLKTYPDEQPIKQTQEVVFQCRDEGSARLPVRWVRDGGRSLPPGSTDIRGRLTMPNIQPEHAGTYYCEATGVPPNTPGWRRPVSLQVVPYEVITPDGPVGCLRFQATCMSGDCINKTQVCDGRPDCKDASDEMRCDPNGCEPNEFQCDNRKCVLKTWLCDFDNDCGDGSDEQNCAPSSPDSICRSNEFSCQSNSQCIPKSFHCDSDVDCMDASDEIGCSKPIIIEPPTRNVEVSVGETFILRCRVRGIPTPLVLWRLNWGHVPSKCTMTSENGFGELVCTDAQPTDQGAYSCEAINGKGSVFATPDAIVTVKGSPTVLCQPPLFNSFAVTPDDCLNCFCFGTTNECYSSDLYITQLPPPDGGSFSLVGANQDQTQGNYVVRDSEYPLSSRYLAHSPPGSRSDQVVLNVDRSKLRGPGDLVVYFSLPDSHKRLRLTSFGGYLHYRIRFSYFGASQTTSHPDVIIRGNNMTLMHVHDGTFRPDIKNQVDVRFFYGHWFKRVVQWGGRIQIEQPATREDIMMVLENMDLLLIRAQYTDGDFINTTLSNVQMDTAEISENQNGQASLVERCICPAGYTGISCQNCAPNYSRVKEGPWLGRCVSNLVCGPNEYGDPTRGIECLPCPCPLATPNNRFSSSCYLDNDGQVTCNCQQGYEGRRCQYCASGYEGSPTVPGDYCKPVGQCDPAGSVDVNPVSGYCQCKDFATGPQCDQCKDGAFYLSERNNKGCIPCFCMGISSRCSSSNLYRQQEYVYFTNDRQGFEVVDGFQQNYIRDDLFVDSDRQELIFRDFPRYGQKVYYWKLPQRFLGNKVTSYGGNLTYTLRFVPAPGGQSSTNSAFDVEIFGNDILLRHFRPGQRSLSPALQETISVPMYEQYWQRQTGQEVNREHLMMALADLEHVYIKATYTTATEEVGLKDVTLDYAESRNTGQERAHAVEMCDCSEEYRGSSCEDCAIGYTRSLSGVHLGTCVPCDCSGHSTECDPDTGVCFNCKDNTAGNYCELCARGYTRHYDTCVRADTNTECRCDPRGTLYCDANRCQCKTHVIGTQCDSCEPEHFHLSSSNPDGCLPCWCSGATSQCFSSNYHRMQLPMQLLSDHGFTFSNRLQTDVIQTGFKVNVANNEISFSGFDNLRDRETYFWSLPQMFTGNRLESYGGNLTVTQRFQTRPGGNTYSEADIIIRSKTGREFIWMRPSPLKQNIEQSDTVLLTEDSFTMNQQPATRSEFLKALSSIEAVLIRATLSEQITSTFLSDVIMDTAVPTQTGQPRAMEVEQCQCPMEYSGLSCETCKLGYYRNAATNKCFQCPCNGHESSCAERLDGSIQCECLLGYYGPRCGESGPQVDDDATQIEVVISEPRIKVVTVNSTVQLACSVRGVTGVQTRIPVSWSKAGGELPYGRSRDDRQGLLVITEVRSSDSGVYICAAVDEYGRVVTNNVTLTVSRGRPVVIVEPQQGRFDVSVRESLSVRCSVEGSPETQVTWTFGRNRPLPPNVHQQNGVLAFHEVQSVHRGEYYCTSTNAYGQGIARIYVNVVTSQPGKTITIQVSEENVVAQPGETVRVKCSAGTTPGSLTIEWSRLAGSLPTKSVVEEGELQIPNAQPVDSGTYVCRITDQRTSLYNETSTRITIAQYTSLPVVQIQPDRQTINQGTNAELFCRVSGSPPPQVTWTKANEPQSARVSVDNNVLRITNAQVSDRGMYICTATNDGGSAQAAAIIEVERREPPQIQMHPDVRQTIEVGGSALFQCHLTAGIPTPTVRWTRTDGQPISSNTEILSGGVLRFNQVRGDEEGSYLCTAENDVGSVTAVAVLEIQSLPVVNLRPGPSPYTVRTGEPVRLECFAEGDPAPLVSWKRMQVNFPTPVPGVSQSPGVSVYEIASVSKADEGVYLCSAQNSAGVTEDRLQLLVQDVLPGTLRPSVPRPDPVGPPSRGDGGVVYIPAGSPYEFSCSGSGPDIEQIAFTFRRSDGRPLPRGARTDKGTLYLANVDESAEGEYACVGTNRTSGLILFTIYNTIEVLVPPRISLDPARQVVRPGEVVRIRCSATGPQPITIEWIKEVGRMPASVIVNGGELTFRGIATTDAGRYICVARNNGGTTRAVAEVVVNEEPLLTATDPQVTMYVGQTGELRCETSGINPSDVRWSRVNGRLPPNAVTRENTLRLPLIELQDTGDYRCEVTTPSGMRLYDIVTLIVRRPQTTNIVIRSTPPVVHRGDEVELICEVENEPAAAITWERVDGELPYRTQSYDSTLRIPSVQSGGTYVCTATTQQGIFDERYHLIIQENQRGQDAQQLHSEHTRYVPLGHSVTLECQPSLSGPVSYTWSKKDGKLPANARTQNSVLDIVEVQAEDAGVYVCTSSNQERTVDLPSLLIVTGVVPRFNDSSYLALPTLTRAYLMFDIEISFKPEHPDGLILYNSQLAGPNEGDFIAFGLVSGYPEFRFNIGAGPAIMRGTQPLEMNQWHTVKLSRNRKEGRMVVNDGDAMVGVSEGRFVGLDLVEPLYLGGVPDFQNVHRQTGMTSGFRGCISRLVTGNTLNTGFVMNAMKRVGVTSCETCQSKPCQNDGVCQEAYNERGHKCFCPAGYLGEQCENAGESCYEGACGTGRCINKPGGFECYCPFGKIGDRCSQDITIYEPAFGDESYIAFPTPWARRRFAVDMNFKPESLDDGVLMYCAQKESGSGDFTSLAIRNKRLEFRFNSGSGTANIQSEPISEGEWIKVRANRTDKLGSLMVNDGPMMTGESPGNNLGLNLLTPLFIGGVDTSRIHVSSDVGVKSGFRGCVSEIKVMDQKMLLNEGVVDAANVDQCGGGASPCSREPCQNNAPCVEDPGSVHGYTCHCPEGYSGENCQHKPGVCNMIQPCKNGGACVGQGHNYFCLCPIGFAGQHCEHVVQNIAASAAFSGNSWVELNRTLLPQEAGAPQVISLQFRTRRPNSLLFWYGQDPTVRAQGQDYISIAVKGGYVEFSYELGGGPAFLRSQSRVDDGHFHSLRVERTGQQGILILDQESPQVAHSPGQLHMLNADGNIYIGGVPDFLLMTGGTHTNGFVGCIQQLTIGSHTVDSFMNQALSGVNVIPCPRQRGGRRKGTRRG